jgi:hypothetical protein
MTDITRRLTILAHGPAGAGKSWLFYTAPGPRLHLDAEGRAEHCPGHKVWWNPADPLPDVEEAGITTDTTVVVDVRAMRDLTNAKLWIDSGNHYFKAVGLDSITDGQDRLVEDVRGTGQADLQDWGVIYDRMNDYILAMKDWRRHATNPIDVIYVGAGTENKDNVLQPYVRGQLGKKLPYRFDIVGYLSRQLDPSSQSRYRDMVIDAAGTPYVAKSNIHEVSEHWPSGRIVNPDLGEILQVINQQPQEALSA